MRRKYRTHAAPAATANSFDHDAAGTFGLLLSEEALCLRKRHRLLTARHQGDTALQGQRTRSGLVTQQCQLLWRGADKANIRLCAGSGKVCVFTQKTIAGMQRIATMRQSDLQQARAVQIRWRPTGLKCNRFIGGTDMHGIRIILRINRQAGDTHLLQCACNAHRNLAAIGDHHFLEHRTLVFIAGCAYGILTSSVQCISRSKRRNTFPAPVAGNASIKRTSRGAL